MILYKLQVGDFGQYDLGSKLLGMRLLNYYPLYMHDTDTAVIPDMAQGRNQQPLVVSIPYAAESFSIFESAQKTNILETINPNTEQAFFTFSLKKEPVPADLPFLDRTFVLKFDILSFTETPEVFKTSFIFFETNLFHKESNKNLTLQIECLPSLNRILISGKPHYQGKITFKAFIEKSNGASIEKTTKTIGSYDVVLSGSNNEAVNNLYEEPFLKTKYKESGFFTIIRPQTIILNVSPFSLFNSRFLWTS